MVECQQCRMTWRNSIIVVGYWASQEQYSMQDLLKFVVEAERGGLKTCLTSDHFHPWWHDNGYGNFTWVWIVAAAERTKEYAIYNRSNCCCLSL